jgi:hypothetical protein
MNALPLLLALSVAADKPEPNPAPPAAKVTVTAPLACLHCTFGEGDSCAVCLKLDDKTPLVLAGKAAKELFEFRLSKKVVTLEGALSLTKEKRMQLTSDVAPKLDKK